MTVSASITTPSVEPQGAGRAPFFVCPFCGLLCDDLPPPGDHQPAVWPETLQALCPRVAAAVVGLAGIAEGAWIDGEPAAVDAAVAEAARRLSAARRPVIGGLGGDVQTSRAALALADARGARVVHARQAAAQRNIFAVQSRGAVTTTLAEARHRAEMVVLVDSDVTRHFPRVLERLAAAPAFADGVARRWLLLGAPPPARVPPEVRFEAVDLGGADLFAAVALLRTFLRGESGAELADQFAALAALAKDMAACRYGVFLWAAADMDFSGADLLIEQLHQLLIDLNRTTRWAALPLAGNDGDLTANAVATWQTGFPLPVIYAEGAAQYDPFPSYDDADLLLWVSALPGVGPPRLAGADPGLPVILVGTPPDEAALPPHHVVIPAAVPGLTAGGHLVRTDSVITLYAPAVMPTALPTAAQVLEELAAAAKGTP
jgi:formylmethanofuran dehydrogenase subunit B